MAKKTEISQTTEISHPTYWLPLTPQNQINLKCPVTIVIIILHSVFEVIFLIKKLLKINAFSVIQGLYTLNYIMTYQALAVVS
jgi:hypothetical protein